jgi:ech hydrogenase subunit D
MDREPFLTRVEEYHKGGWRLALVNAASVLSADEAEQGAVDVTWAFARGAEFEHLRERIMPGDEVPSISPSFGAAFLYENEMRELFGLNVVGINVDLQGQLYKTSQKVPFSPSAIRARLEANAAAGIASAVIPVAGAPVHGAKPAPAVAAPAAAVVPAQVSAAPKVGAAE